MNKFADSCLQKLANHKAVLTIPEVDKPLFTHCDCSRHRSHKLYDIINLSQWPFTQELLQSYSLHTCYTHLYTDIHYTVAVA